MPRPIQSQEVFSDLSFPTRGLDLSRGYGSQQPGTAPIGVNVRTYEPTLMRARGGSRPGLSPYLPQLPNGAHLVQHINFVVTVTSAATTDISDATGILDPSDAGPASGWATGKMTRNPGRRIRVGGHGRQHNKQPKTKTGQIKFVQSNVQGFSTLPPQSVTFSNPVAKGNLLVAIVAQGEPSFPAVSDSLGNLYTQVGTEGTAGILRLSMWYAINKSDGANSVSFTCAAAHYTALAILEYSGVDPQTTLDGNVPGNTTYHTSLTSLTTQAIPVANNGEMLLAAFGQNDAVLTFTKAAGWNLRCNQPDGNAFMALYVVDMLNQQAPQTATGTLSPPGAGYVDFGASFIPVP